MKIKAVKADWKQAQRIARLLLKRGKPLHQGKTTVDLGIRTLKKTGAKNSEVNKFKSDAWEKHQKASQ